MITRKEAGGMMTVKEVSRLTGVSIRTLHYYDQIGLLTPSDITESGYRLYDDTALERLSQILLFRELEFPLKDIRRIIDSGNFDRQEALRQQITLLTMKKERLEKLIAFAREIEITGGEHMDFTAFDTGKIDEYARQAKEKWGGTEAFAEFEEKSKDRSREEQTLISQGMMEIFAEFGKMMAETPESGIVQKQVEKLQNYITEHFYTCTKEILSGLGKMYGAGGEFTENIDKAGGKGCAEFCAKAIEIYTCL